MRRSWGLPDGEAHLYTGLVDPFNKFPLSFSSVQDFVWTYLLLQRMLDLVINSGVIHSHASLNFETCQSLDEMM